jgi:hypothetical protein
MDIVQRIFFVLFPIYERIIKKFTVGKLKNY